MATDSISLNALHPEHRRYIELQARVLALGFELYGDNEAEHERGYYVVDPKAAVVFVEAAGCTLEGIANWCAEREAEAAGGSRAVKVWRAELADDIARLDSTLSGLSARMTALDKNKAPIDNATLAELNRLDKRLNTIVGAGRYEGVDYEDDVPDAELAAAEKLEAPEPFDNPIRAFLLGTNWLEGSCYCGHHSAQHGHELVAAMAAEIKEEDADPTIALTVEQCSDVLAFIRCRTEREKGHITWSGGYVDYAFSAKYNGDPGFGLFAILTHVERQLRKGGAE